MLIYFFLYYSYSENLPLLEHLYSMMDYFIIETRHLLATKEHFILFLSDLVV